MSVLSGCKEEEQEHLLDPLSQIKISKSCFSLFFFPLIQIQIQIFNFKPLNHITLTTHPTIYLPLPPIKVMDPPPANVTTTSSHVGPTSTSPKMDSTSFLKTLLQINPSTSPLHLPPHPPPHPHLIACGAHCHITKRATTLTTPSQNSPSP